MGLEYCPNGELYQQLQERGPLPQADAAQYAAELVDILAYLRCDSSLTYNLERSQPCVPSGIWYLGWVDCCSTVPGISLS